MDETELYCTDRPAWIALVAPRMVARIADPSSDDAMLAYAWTGMARDYQTAVWALLDEASKERIKRIRREAA